jgi:hypothetical protein
MGEAEFVVSSFFTEDNCFVANPNSEKGFLSWKDGDLGACGYGKILELRFVAAVNKSTGLLEGLELRVVAPNNSCKN